MPSRRKSNVMDDKTEKVALFRYGLIAPLVLETLPRGELTRRAQQIAARLYDFPHSTRRQVSVDTLLDWTLRYRRNGLEALSPKTRQDRGHARAVASETAALIERLKRENPHRTGAALLRELATASEAHQAGLSASTLYRFLRARGLTERQLLLDKATAHKKYEAEFANRIWQSDMLFGPWVGRPGGGKQQVFLQAALDDASRLIPHAQFYPNQGLDAFLDCLRQAIAARGIPTRLYMDNAKIYRSPQLARIAASIGILIVHTPPYQPEGRGKIERFFRSSVVDNRRTVMWPSQLCGPGCRICWVSLIPLESAPHKLAGIVGLQFNSTIEVNDVRTTLSPSRNTTPTYDQSAVEGTFGIFAALC